MMRALSRERRVALTVALVLAFVAVVLISFVLRVQQPRLMSEAELNANGLVILDTPRALSDFRLTDHRGDAFTPEDLSGHWSLVFFGFTQCPDVCPTTMALLDRFHGALEGTEAEEPQVVMVSVDPARDTPPRLAGYVPYFNEAFVGVTGEFLDLFRFATELNAPFRKVPGQGDDYLVDHSANVVLINPRGDYHGFFRAPLDLARMKVTFRAVRQRWEQ